MQQLGDFILERQLGEGGMGIVFLARSKRFAHPVALKVLKPMAEEQEVKRFRAEARAVSRLEHPNIVRVFEHRTTPQGHHYMAMELVQGESLDVRVRNEGPMEPDEGADVGIQLASALAYAHAAGVLHRDLKPHNVLIDGGGQIKVTDFGLAKVQGTESLTRTGEVVGTPVYMAPEQALAQRDKIDARTDVYGAGATLYHVLTGRMPFSAKGLTALLKKIVQDDPRPMREIRPEIPSHLASVVAKCLAKEPEKRYQSAADLEAALRSRGGFFSWLKRLFGG